MSETCVRVFVLLLPAFCSLGISDCGPTHPRVAIQWNCVGKTRGQILPQDHGNLSRFALVAGLRVYYGQVRSRHNLKPSGTRFEGVSGLRV